MASRVAFDGFCHLYPCQEQGSAGLKMPPVDGLPLAESLGVAIARVIASLQ